MILCNANFWSLNVKNFLKMDLKKQNFIKKCMFAIKMDAWRRFFDDKNSYTGCCRGKFKQILIKIVLLNKFFIKIFVFAPEIDRKVSKFLTHEGCEREKIVQMIIFWRICGLFFC